MTRSCDFCDLSTFQERLIHRDHKSVVSVLSNPALTDFHALIIPRRHVEPGRDVLTEEEIFETESEKDRLTDVFRALGFKGVDVWQKTRPDVPEGSGGTKMDHLHTHVLPSNPGEGLYDEGIVWGVRGMFQVVTRQRIDEQLRALHGTERMMQHGN